MTTAHDTRGTQVRQSQLMEAIRAGRVVLETAWGRRRVISYDPATGEAVTNNRGDFWDRRTFVVCASDLIILEAPHLDLEG